MGSKRMGWGDEGRAEEEEGGRRTRHGGSEGKTSNVDVDAASALVTTKRLAHFLQQRNSLLPKVPLLACLVTMISHLCLCSQS